MNAVSWFKKLFKDEGKHYLKQWIPADNVRYSSGKEPEVTTIVAGEHYFRLWLTEMFLKDERNWFADWHPAVHSAVNFEFGGNTKLVTKIAGPSMLKDLDEKHLNRVIQQNHELTSLMPFNGGTVGLSIGMLAMKGQDGIKSFIKVLGDFSNLLMVPQLSAAMKVADPLADGIAELIDATDGELMLGLEDTYSSEGGGAEAVLRSGYIAIVLAEEDDVKPKKLWVKKDELHYGSSMKESEHLKRYNYMLLRLEGRAKRDDWDSLESIQTPYEKAIEFLQLQKIEEAKTFLRSAIAAALTSPDLTKKSDRRRVVTLLKERYKEAEQAFGAGASRTTMDKRLSSLMSNAMSVEEATTKPEMTEEEAFEGIY